MGVGFVDDKIPPPPSPSPLQGEGTVTGALRGAEQVFQLRVHAAQSVDHLLRGKLIVRAWERGGIMARLLMCWTKHFDAVYSDGIQSMR